MAVVETERHGQVLVVRMNRPERLNALNTEMRAELARIWTDFRHDKQLEVAIFTGTGRGFCAGEDMKESLEKGKPGGQRPAMEDPFMTRRAREAGDRRDQRLRHGRRLHAGRAHRPAGRRARGGVRGLRGQALAARRLQSRPRRQPALSDRDGDGAGLPLHRAALLRSRLPQSHRRRRRADADGDRAWPSTCSPCRPPRGSTPCT